MLKPRFMAVLSVLCAASACSPREAESVTGGSTETPLAEFKVSEDDDLVKLIDVSLLEPDNPVRVGEETVERVYTTGKRMWADYARASEDWNESIQLFNEIVGTIEEALLKDRYAPLGAMGELFILDLLSSQEHSATAEAFLDEHWGTVAQIRRLADAGLPVFVLDYSQGLEIDLPHLAELRALVRILAGDTCRAFRQGDVDLAVQNHIAALRLQRCLSEDLLLICQLVRFGLCATANETHRVVFEEGALGRAQTLSILEETKHLYMRDAMVRSLQGEACGGLELFGHVQHANFEALRSLELQEEIFDSLGNLLKTPAGALVVVEDRRTYATHMEQLVNLARQPLYRARPGLEEWEQLFERISEQKESIELKAGGSSEEKASMWVAAAKDFFSLIFMAGLSRTCVVEARHEAMLDLMRLGLLVELYRSEHGAYPESLDAVASDLGEPVPVDPFTGRSYVYKVRNDSFLLYSLGENGVDDSGVHHPVEKDIVWRGEEPPEPASSSAEG